MRECRVLAHRLPDNKVRESMVFNHHQLHVYYEFGAPTWRNVASNCFRRVMQLSNNPISICFRGVVNLRRPMQDLISLASKWKPISLRIETRVSSKKLSRLRSGRFLSFKKTTCSELALVFFTCNYDLKAWRRKNVKPSLLPENRLTTKFELNEDTHPINCQPQAITHQYIPVLLGVIPPQRRPYNSPHSLITGPT